MNSNKEKRKFQLEVNPLKADEYDPCSTYFEYVRYSKTGKTRYVNCLVCRRDNRPVCNDVNAYDHCKLPSHIESMERAMEESQEHAAKLIRLVRAGMEYEADILNLGHKSWQNDIRSLLVPYHKISDNCAVTVDYRQVRNQLKMYTFMETVSLLELAAWKAAVLIDYHPTGIYEFMEFIRRGWKKHKKGIRQSNLIVNIVRSVMPFLETPKLE